MSDASAGVGMGPVAHGQESGGWFAGTRPSQPAVGLVIVNEL